MTKKKTEQFVREPFKPVEGAAFIEVPHDELVRRACDILSQERAKPRDIAWAWAFLCALEHGKDFRSEESSYRAIYELHEWMKKQGFKTFDANGMPTTPSKGVRAVKPDDIEDLMMLRVADVKARAKLQGVAWPENQGVQINAPKAVPRAPVQDEAILRIIAELGFDPLNLPPFRRGAHGESVKQQIRTEALKNCSTFTKDSFKKAWERLSRDKRIYHPAAPKDSP